MLFRFSVQCLEAVSCTVFFEPEGGHVELARGEVITVEMSGKDGPFEPEIAYLPTGVIVGAWPGAETTARNSEGRELDI